MKKYFNFIFYHCDLRHETYLKGLNIEIYKDDDNFIFKNEEPEFEILIEGIESEYIYFKFIPNNKTNKLIYKELNKILNFNDDFYNLSKIEKYKYIIKELEKNKFEFSLTSSEDNKLYNKIINSKDV